MASVSINPDHVREFADADDFRRWLGNNHDSAPELWINIHKRGSGLRSISPEQAIEVALCWGWIDGIRKGLDDRSFFQRYSPRGSRSVWSRKNVETVGRLIADGRMTEHGLKPVEAAKADGRWDKAYGSGREMAIPPDLQKAIDAEPLAKEMLGKLSERNRFALAFRVHHMKTEAGRKRKIETFVAMLKRGETIYPQKPA
ncbi:YdeI/OmpD-associated family protein [Rhizobium sp. TRM95111]|uniref:YdeI/OmpD-associated family protein n=1 Tax=Rhizobium alarense TaxID=2846851 RepID=UPI001F373980|nr:YdeI/OmpD-associated family protein [Rhizobium alarense]MCF3642554.1 YdeI/OmpD-associated family protein [Rhizobium alarense]